MLNWLKKWFNGNGLKKWFNGQQFYHGNHTTIYSSQPIHNQNLLAATLNNSIAMASINYLINQVHSYQWSHNFNNYFTNDFGHLMEEILTQWMFHGNCFITLENQQLKVLKTVDVHIHKKFFYKNQPLKDFIHLKNYNIYDDVKGIGPLDAVATHIIQYNTVNNYLNGIAGRGGITSGLIICKTPMDNDQRYQLQNDIKDFYKNVNSQGTIMVLEGDFSWQSIAIAPNDLDIKKLNHYNGSAIARGLGVHPVLIGLDKRSYGGLQYNSIHDQFIENTLKPLYNKIINQLTQAIKIQWDKDVVIQLNLNTIEFK